METNKLITFIDSNEISIRQIETDLNLPHGSISIAKKYISSKYVEKVEKYLGEKHGLSGEFLQNVENSDNSGEKPKKVKKYNEGRIPDWQDGKMRFIDKENGLWRRIEEVCMTTKDNVRVIKDTWLPKDASIHNDTIGNFYIANNGEKVYLFEKKVEKITL